MIHDLWTERYRPSTVDGYVFQNDAQKALVEEWIKTETIPHLLFSGPAGTGKTTLAKILIKNIGVDEYDVLEINASRENSVDTIRDKITGFVQTIPFGKFKVVLLDEADYISHNGQAALRGVIEMYAASARFILTCNIPRKIIPALKSRTQEISIAAPEESEYARRVLHVLDSEKIEYDPANLFDYINSSYPDLRKCLNLLQQSSTRGVLEPFVDKTTDSNLVEATKLLKAGQIREARKLICSSFRKGDADGIFRWAYENLDLWGSTPEQQDRAIVIIRNGLVNHALVGDEEINLSATLTELTQIEQA